MSGKSADEGQQPVKNTGWIAAQLEEVPVVDWDRFVVEDHDGDQCVRVYGWIDRVDDEYRDFVIARFWPEHETFGYTTSSDAYTEYLHQTWFPDDPLDDHDPCRRVEHAFDVKNAIELAEDASLGEFA